MAAIRKKREEKSNTTTGSHSSTNDVAEQCQDAETTAIVETADDHQRGWEFPTYIVSELTKIEHPSADDSAFLSMTKTGSNDGGILSSTRISEDDVMLRWAEIFQELVMENSKQREQIEKLKAELSKCKEEHEEMSRKFTAVQYDNIALEEKLEKCEKLLVANELSG